MNIAIELNFSVLQLSITVTPHQSEGRLQGRSPLLIELHQPGSHTAMRPSERRARGDAGEAMIMFTMQQSIDRPWIEVQKPYPVS